MKQKKASQIVLWLLLVSTVLLVLSYFNIVDKPFALPPDPEQLIQIETDGMSTDQVESSDNPTGSEVDILPSDNEEIVPSEVQATDSDEIDDSDTTGALKELVFTNINPDDITTDGTKLRVWPEESSVPQARDPNAPVLAQPNSDKPLAGAFVILDPGHGGSDIGVSWQGEEENDVLLEKNINLEIATKIQEELTRQGADVRMTRSTDEKHSYFYIMAYTADLLLQRYANDIKEIGFDPEPLENLRLLMQDVIRINSGLQDSGGRGIFDSIGTPPNLKLIYDIESEYKDTVFISIHLETSDQAEDKGVRVRYMSKEYAQDMNNSYAVGTDALKHSPNYNRYNSKRRESMAQLLADNLVATDSRMKTNLQPVIEDDLAVLRLNNVTSAQLTCGFLSNEEDRARVTSSEGQALIARGVATALLRYYTGDY